MIHSNPQPLSPENGAGLNAGRRCREFDLGPVESIPLGQGQAYIVADLIIAVFRQRDGRLFATDNNCPHRNGPLADGIIGAGKLICPLHAWKFDLETGHCLGEEVTIQTYPVREVNGRLMVEIQQRTEVKRGKE
jgi:nitrite reductase (NADH) small subunit